MVLRRVAVPLLAALALAPGVASAGIPVVMYPFRVPGLSAAQRAELHGLIQAGLASAARRGILAPRSQILLPTVCGENPAPACLAEAGKGALVLAGRGEVKGGLVLVTAALWDTHGAQTREVRFVVDLVIQNLRPVTDSIAELEMEIEPDGRVARDMRLPAARDPHGPAATKAPSLAAAPPSSPREPPPAATKAISATPGARVETSAVPRLWKRKAGPWLTAIGAVLLGGGAAVGYLNHNLADDLDAKYAGGELTAADRTSYDRVKTYNLLSTALFAAGGAATAAGTWIWISAPARPGAPPAIGAGGRF
jgi:hypothetical protein